ncbi:serine/threonine-protein kinase haspin [Corvus moneduloides]|uniref:serine/threonine-protein kinase haspin n=1 Tax=Corvus moneduloides TaxID=1196302 RepID=UPI0013643245|nr:serine/threonine-protein kinase haspin [Corvus moneduloides]
MPLQPRLLRTYSRRAGYLRPLPPPDRWISPPQDRKRLFSSTSAASSAASSVLSASSARSSPSDDPDFSPPEKRRLQPVGKRPAWARRLRARRKDTRGPAGKENREPAEKENRKPENRGRGQETRGRGKEKREPAGKKKKWSQGKEPGRRREERRESPPSLSSPSPCPSPPRGSRRRRQGPLCAARRPLLCSTPQWAPPPRRAALGPLGPLSSATDSASGLGDSPPRRRRGPPARLSSLLLSTTIEGGSGLGDSRSPHRLPRSSPEGCPGQSPSLLDAGEEVPEWFRPKGAAGSREPELGLRGSRRVLRSSVRGPCRAQALPSPQKAPSTPQEALAPIEGEPQPPEPCDSATCEETCEVPNHLMRNSAKRSSSCHRDLAKEYQLVPVVVLDPLEVPMRLKSMELHKQADAQPACLQPGSPVGRQGILENKHKRTKGLPGEGSTCRKACISGFSASRWGRHTRFRPKRHKNKRQQQPNNSLFRLQTRQKQALKGAVEMSADVRDNDYSLLNGSYSWARVRASLSFHKKKKVTTDESFCSSILCSPSGKSQLSGYQASLSAGKAQGCSWFASSMVLLAPRDSSSVLELLLTDAEKVFGECNQEGPIAFEECIPLDKMKDCKKIGEGVFGEVFQIDSERGPVALKIIPIEGTEKINGEAQKSFGEILPEVIISKELSLLSEGSVNRTVGFISLYTVHCVQGPYPRYLLEAWDKFHEETGSENDRPDFFGAQQLFMVLEFEFGGRDLERMRSKFSSVASARSILHQVTASLAVAEQELHFEHRDLHWGNVLVKNTDVKELQYVLNGATHSIPTAGIHVNIIDYTLSRLEKDGLTVFCDLSTDEELFQGTGDYQFDIYRQMKEENSNSWTDYHPHSNVLWLHYLADKLLRGMSYKKKASTPALKKIKMQLSKFHKEVLTFESAHDVLHHSSLFQ